MRSLSALSHRQYLSALARRSPQRAVCSCGRQWQRQRQRERGAEPPAGGTARTGARAAAAPATAARVAHRSRAPRRRLRAAAHESALSGGARARLLERCSAGVRADRAVRAARAARRTRGRQRERARLEHRRPRATAPRVYCCSDSARPRRRAASAASAEAIAAAAAARLALRLVRRRGPTHSVLRGISRPTEGAALRAPRALGPPGQGLADALLPFPGEQPAVTGRTGTGTGRRPRGADGALRAERESRQNAARIHHVVPRARRARQCAPLLRARLARRGAARCRPAARRSRRPRPERRAAQLEDARGAAGTLGERRHVPREPAQAVHRVRAGAVRGAVAHSPRRVPRDDADARRRPLLPVLRAVARRRRRLRRRVRTGAAARTLRALAARVAGALVARGSGPERALELRADPRRERLPAARLHGRLLARRLPGHRRAHRAAPRAPAPAARAAARLEPRVRAAGAQLATGHVVRRGGRAAHGEHVRLLLPERLLRPADEAERDRRAVERGDPRILRAACEQQQFRLEPEAEAEPVGAGARAGAGRVAGAAAAAGGAAGAAPLAQSRPHPAQVSGGGGARV